MARTIHLAEDCTLLFAGRSTEFADGVEIGILSAQMDHGISRLVRLIHSGNVEQLRSVAQKLGYRLILGATDGDHVHAHLQATKNAPTLRVVSG